MKKNYKVLNEMARVLQSMRENGAAFKSKKDKLDAALIAASFKNYAVNTPLPTWMKNSLLRLAKSKVLQNHSKVNTKFSIF